MGTYAKDIWGIQWIKMLALIYQGVTEGLPTGSNDEKLLIGGPSPEGRSARMRVLLVVERVMKATMATMTVKPEPPRLFS
jgi:nucleoporin GLE1